MPTWTKPEVSEIKMDAEIGSYQLDDEPREPFVSTREAQPSEPRYAESNARAG